MSGRMLSVELLLRIALPISFLPFFGPYFFYQSNENIFKINYSCLYEVRNQPWTV